jgi:hypothetical protein
MTIKNRWICVPTAIGDKPWIFDIYASEIETVPLNLLLAH